MMEHIVIKVEPQDYFEDEMSMEMAETSEQGGIVNNCDLTKVKEEAPEIPPETEPDPLYEFCFESDHLSLKENSDYKNLIKAVSVLEAQRSKAIRDLDRLYELQEEALADPIAFVERLQRKENIGIPGPQKVYPVPVVDWNKYSLSGSLNGQLTRRQLTRLSSKTTQDILKNSSRGKSMDHKPIKVSQYWSAEEQKRLEEMLILFPPEEIESRRWEKIANCLENRTPVQVASRVQKYFIKLMKAGIPIPGRMPSMAYLRKPRRSVIRQQPSTFLVSHTLPVYMPEAEEEYACSYYQPQSTDENSMEFRIDMSDDDEISAEFKDSPEFKELMLLKKVQKEKLQTCNQAQHLGFKCSWCKVEPIMGVRWHCSECKPPLTVDLCEYCVDSKQEIGQHTIEHRLEAIHQTSSGFQDRDYMHFLGSDYNYLDPNYMPAA